MPKFIMLIFIAALTSSGLKSTEPSSTSRLASMVFSEKPLGYESGEPVFTKGLKATILRQSDARKVRVQINDSVDVNVNSEIIELYELVELESGTYTVVVELENSTETFGFSIR